MVLVDPHNMASLHSKYGTLKLQGIVSAMALEIEVKLCIRKTTISTVHGLTRVLS